MSDEIKLAVAAEKGRHNYSAYSPDLPGCVTTGRTIEETIANMRDAALFHLEGLEEDGAVRSGRTVAVATHLLTITRAQSGRRTT